MRELATLEHIDPSTKEHLDANLKIAGDAVAYVNTIREETQRIYDALHDRVIVMPSEIKSGMINRAITILDDELNRLVGDRRLVEAAVNHKQDLEQAVEKLETKIDPRAEDLYDNEGYKYLCKYVRAVTDMSFKTLSMQQHLLGMRHVCIQEIQSALTQLL